MYTATIIDTLTGERHNSDQTDGATARAWVESTLNALYAEGPQGADTRIPDAISDIMSKLEGSEEPAEITDETLGCTVRVVEH